MEFKDMSVEMTEKEIKTILYIILPDSKFRYFKRMTDFIRVWYTMPNDTGTEHRIDLLPDNIYYVDDADENIDLPVTDGEILHKYYQFMIAKGYSLIWKGNPYIL